MRPFDFPSPGPIAIVTVSYNSSDELAGFLDSVKASDVLPITVIVDNNSADLERTYRVAEDHGSAAVLSLGENKGYGGAVNAAVEALPDSVEFILVSNPDVRLSNDTISVLADFLRERPDVGAVGPRVLNADGTSYPSARSFPSLRTGIGHATLHAVWPSNPWSRRYLANRDSTTQPHAVDWLSGSCLMVRRTAYEGINGFDESYFMYFEDVDLGYRLAKAGWNRIFLPTTSVVHSGAHSTTTESARMIRAHHDSAYLYLRTKYQGRALAPLRWILRMGLDLRASYLTRRAP